MVWCARSFKSYELVCASAFHPPAIGVVNGQSIKYGKKEMMIGAFQDYCYENAYYQLSKGESIFLFSDGCFEVETEEVNFEFNDFVEILHSAEQEKNGSLQKIHSTLLSIMNSDKFVDDFSILKLSL
ncbi:MAG: SpoIIE family protein phosphatase [Melioribacteraceae bacterium]|nr:SpoIIE family protein phosphatase [Melioribacteraceae bacterium]